jgi:hypothetical protein
MISYWAEATLSKNKESIIKEELRKIYRFFRQLSAQIIQEGIREGNFRKDINPQNVASVIMASMDGLFLQYLLEKRSLDFCKINHSALDIILHGIVINK